MNGPLSVIDIAFMVLGFIAICGLLTHIVGYLRSKVVTEDVRSSTDQQSPPAIEIHRKPESKPVQPWHWHRSRIIIAGLVCVVSLVLFPPWKYWYPSTRTSTPAPRSFILIPPETTYSRGVSLDVARLITEAVAAAGLTAIALLIRARTTGRAINSVSDSGSTEIKH